MHRRRIEVAYGAPTNNILRKIFVKRTLPTLCRLQPLGASRAVGNRETAKNRFGNEVYGENQGRRYAHPEQSEAEIVGVGEEGSNIKPGV